MTFEIPLEWHKKLKSVSRQAESNLKVLSIQSGTLKFLDGLLTQDLQKIRDALQHHGREIDLSHEIEKAPYWQRILMLPGGLEVLIEQSSLNHWNAMVRDILVYAKFYETKECGEVLLAYQLKFGKWPDGLKSWFNHQLPSCKFVPSWLPSVFMQDLTLKDPFSLKTHWFNWLELRTNQLKFALVADMGVFDIVMKAFNEQTKDRIESQRKDASDSIVYLSNCDEYAGVLNSTSAKILLNHAWSDDWSLFNKYIGQNDQFIHQLKASIQRGDFKPWGIDAQVFKTSAMERWMSLELLKQDVWFDPANIRSFHSRDGELDSIDEREGVRSNYWMDVFTPVPTLDQAKPENRHHGVEDKQAIDSLSEPMIQWIRLFQCFRLVNTAQWSVEGMLYWMHQANGVLPEVSVDKGGIQVKKLHCSERVGIRMEGDLPPRELRMVRRWLEFKESHPEADPEGKWEFKIEHIIKGNPQAQALVAFWREKILKKKWMEVQEIQSSQTHIETLKSQKPRL